MRLLALFIIFPLLTSSQNWFPRTGSRLKKLTVSDANFLGFQKNDLKIFNVIQKLQKNGIQWANEACVEDIEDLADSLLSFGKNLVINHTFVLTKFDQEVTMKVIDSNGALNGGFLDGRSVFAGRFSECRLISYKKPDRSHIWQGDMFRLFFGGRNGSVCDPDGTIFGIDFCLPVSCSANEVKNLLWQQFDQLCLVGKNAENHANKKTAVTYITICVMSAIAGISIAAGIVDYCLLEHLKNTILVQNIWFKLFRAFSLSKNMKDVLNTDNVNKPGQIGPLNCMRFLSMCWIIMGHANSFMLGYLSNIREIVRDADKPLFYIISNSYFSVDTFFFIGGVLLSYLWFKELKRNRRGTLSGKAWLMFYVHRIIRLSPCYYLAVLFWSWILLPYIPDSSNNLNMVDVPEDPCRQYWWVNFLYLQNIVHAKEECYGITWYLATDMQMYIFTPLLLIPFAYNMVLGLAMASSVLLLSTAANIYTVYHFRFPGFPPALNAQDPKVKHADDYSMLMYEAPWIRCQVYIIGILVGYLLHNKKTIRINKTLNLALFLLSFAVMLFVVMIPSANPHQHLMPLFWRAAYSALSKPLWGLCLSWIVISCYYGYGGLVNSFMSWPGWAPLGRLTYTAYLIHFLIIYYFIDIHEPEIFWGNFLDLFANFTAPAILITYVLSLLWSSLFEVPIGKVESLLLSNHRRRGGEKLEQEKPIIENGVAGQDRQNEVLPVKIGVIEEVQS